MVANLNPLSEWLYGLPGPIRAQTYDGCLRKALESSGSKMTLDEFERHLWSAGYRPSHRSAPDEPGGMVWVLALPEPQPSNLTFHPSQAR